jgi:hypothetical protein
MPVWSQKHRHGEALKVLTGRVQEGQNKLSNGKPLSCMVSQEDIPVRRM